MAKSTKKTYKSSAKGKLKPVAKKVSVNVAELNYSEKKEYIEEKYAPFIVDAQMIFSIWDSGIEYDYKGDRKQVTQSIIEAYRDLADYTEQTLPQETIYEIQDWDLVRRDIDPDTDEVIGETPLEELSADNTYNFSYNGLVDLNWRVYHDEDYDRYFYVIMPHLGGDIRGNYGDAIILEGNDKDELFYRFYEGFISGGASIYFKFIDGSEIGFDSEQDSDVFSFRLNEVFEPTGMAKEYLEDYEKFDSWYGDDFLEGTIDIYLARKGVAPKMMAGGNLNDETPMAFIQILGYDEGEWFNLSDYSDGQDVIDAIYDWMNELNKELGGNREEYEVTDYEGFGGDLYDEYMGANEFEEIIEAYEKYQSSDFPADVISAYKNDSGSRNDSLSDIIDEMENNYFGKYDNLNDFGYEMVEQGVYQPSEYDVYITDTDKRILAGEVSDNMVDDMSFDDLLNVASDTKSDYEDEKSELEDKIVEIQSEIDDLTALQDSTDDDNEYELIAEQIEEKEFELEEAEDSYTDIESRYEDKAREEARELFYDETYDKLENDLESWLSDYGYDTENLADISFISVDYEKIGDDLSSDYLIVEYDGEMYFFNNYAKGGRLVASKRKPKYDFYIVESSTKKLVSGYSTKAEATEQRKLLVKEYPSMRFEIYTLGNLEAKTDLDVYAKKDYVELSTLDKIKKVSVDAYRYGQEKVGQANAFLEKHDVKGKIKRGAKSVWEKTKQGGNWLKRQWQEADFGDGKGKAKFFADGGEIDNLKSDLNKYKNVDIRFKLIPNDGSEEDGDENDLSLNYIGEIYGGGLDSDEPFVELGFQVNDETDDSNNLKSDLNKYKNVDIRFKLIPNDGSEEDGDENDLSLNYIGEIYGGGLDTDEPFVELGFQVNDEYADGGGVSDRMTYEEMKQYEKGRYIHYNPMNSRWEVWNNGELKEFWNQEQAEKFAGFEFDDDKDSRYSRKKYEALFGYEKGGGVNKYKKGDKIIGYFNYNYTYDTYEPSYYGASLEVEGEVIEDDGEWIKLKWGSPIDQTETINKRVLSMWSYADGGEAGGWKIGDKFRVLKGIYGDYNSPRYANQEFEVINIREGKYIDARNKRGNTETFDAKNIEKLSFADGGELYDIYLPMGFYVKINPHYTATIRNLNSFQSYLERKDELWGNEFGEITNVDKSASKEWVAELKRLIAEKKAELEKNGTGKYKVGDEITIWRNQAERDAYVVAVSNNEILVEYEMPNGTSALNIIDITLPEYNRDNYKKNYKAISYENARTSKKWGNKIDASTLINNPQGSAKRFDDGGGVDDYFTMKDGSKMSKVEWYKKMEDKLGFEKFAERILKDSQFGQKINAPSNELTHNRLNKKAVIGKKSVTISSYTPNYKRYLDSKTFDNLKELDDYLNKNQILADGGGVDDELFEALYKKYRDKDYFFTNERIESAVRNWESFVQKGDENAKKYTKQDIVNHTENVAKQEAFYTYSSLKQAIENNDKQFLKSRIRYDQKFSKDIFESLTGEKLPSSNSEIAKFIDSKDFQVKQFADGGDLSENNYRISISEDDKYIGEYPNPISDLIQAKSIFLQLETKYRRPKYLISVYKRATSTSGMEKVDVSSWYEFAEKYADGGMAQMGEVSGMLPNPLPMSTIQPMAEGGEATEFKKGGNVSSIEKRVAEVNALINEGNEKGIQVVDKTSTWEAPMKYNPIKYTNGVLYVSYKQLDLYKHNKGMGSEWKNESYRIGKNEMGQNSFRGSAQTDALSQIARMYRTAINEFNKYGYADGGIIGEIYGKRDGSNKIDIYYKTSKGEHHYLISSNSSKTINEAVEKYKNTLAGNSQTSFAERKRIDRLEGKFADGGQPVQYIPVQAVPQQPVQYVPVQQVQQQMPQQPANSPMGNMDINSALEFVKQNPQVLAMLKYGGGVEDEMAYINNRIHNLEELVVVINEEDKPEMYETINKLKRERENLKNKANNPEEIKPKKSFFGLFKEGGEINLPKDNSKVHFTDDQNREYDGIFVAEGNGNPSMFLVGFGEGASDFRFAMEVIDWYYLDDKNNDDAHERHEASETAEEEKAEHEYDVYDNKRMLQNQANEIEHHSEELNNQVQKTKRVPAWVIAKMERATTDLSDITHYLDGENKMANGGVAGEVKYEILPHLNKFIVAKVTYKQHEDYTYPSKDFIYGFNGKFLEFDDMKSAQNFINNIEPKYPYGVPKANVGMLLLASQLMQQKQQQPQQQPQVVYYVPQPTETEHNTGIKQDIPEMADGGELDDSLINDFCITNLIELANEIQPVKYFVTDRFKETDIKSKQYKGRLIIVFKEVASVSVIEAINNFIERAEDCHHILEQSVNVSGSEPTSVSINLLSDRYSDIEFGKGGKVYDYAPKKINLDKTKKIRTILGEYIIGLITNDFVYFVNPSEGDDNANTIMYNKKGELLSDNYFASGDLYGTLMEQSDFEFIHPDLEAYRQELLKEN